MWGNHKFAFKLLFAIVALDNIASAIVMPVLMELLYPCTIQASCKSISISENIVLLSGLIFLLSPSYVFSTPIIGRLSDIYGRKLALILCLGLSIAGYLLLLVANMHRQVVLILLAVLLLNAGSSSMTPVQAAMIDGSNGNERSYLFGLITIVLFPLYLTIAELSKYLLDSSHDDILVGAFIITLAFFISIGNLLILNYVPLIKQRGQKSAQRANLFTLAAIFKPGIVLVLLIFAFFQFSTSLYFVTMVDIPQLHMSFIVTGFNLFLYYKIVIMTLGLLIVYPLLLKRCSTYQLIYLSLSICCASILVYFMLPIAVIQWLAVALFTMAEMLLVPSIWRLLSDMTNAANQGLMMGIKGTLWSLSWSLGLIMGNWVNNKMSFIFSIALASILLLSSFILTKYVLIKYLPRKGEYLSVK